MTRPENRPAPDIAPGDAPGELCRLWLEHADRQAACLERLLGGMRSLRESLAQGRWSDHLERLTALESDFQENADLRASRRALQQRMEAGAVPSLDALAARAAAGEGGRLRAQKTRLQSLAADLQHQARATGLLARHHLDFFQAFFTDLTKPAAGACYGPEGKLQIPAPFPLIQVRG